MYSQSGSVTKREGDQFYCLLKVKNIGVMSKLKNNHKASRVAETPFFYNHLTYINIYQI